MIRKLAIYDLSEIQKAAQIEAYAFEGLKDLPEGLQTVIRFREEVEKLLQSFDQRWIALSEGDTLELIEWASRMRLIRNKLDELDRQIAVADRPRLFNWDTVASCMGLINSFRVAVEQVINHSEEAKVA